MCVQGGAGGLSAYLEDIDSDDEDALLREGGEGGGGGKAASKTAPLASSSPAEAPMRPSKEELLQMMEKVDRDISTTEAQILTLQKKRVRV